MKLPFHWRYVVATADPEFRRPQSANPVGVVNVDLETTSAHTFVVEVLDNENQRMRAQTPPGARYDNWRVPRAREMDMIFRDLYERYGSPSEWINYFGEIVVRGLQEVHRSVMMQDSMLGSSDFGGILEWSNPLLAPKYQNPTTAQTAAMKDNGTEPLHYRTPSQERLVSMTDEYIRHEKVKSTEKAFRSSGLTKEEFDAAAAAAEVFRVRHPGVPHTVSSKPDPDGVRRIWTARQTPRGIE